MNICRAHFSCYTIKFKADEMSCIRQISRVYGTSSKSATNFNSSKDNNIHVVKTTAENLISLVWKSLSYASSLLKSDAVLSIQRKSGDEISSKDVSHVKSTDVGNIASPPSRTNNSSLAFNKEPPAFLVENITSEKDTDIDESFYDWIRGRNSRDKQDTFASDIKPVKVCKTSLEQRSRFLVESLRLATTSSSHVVRLEEICNHLLMYPQQGNVMYKEGLLRVLYWLQGNSMSSAVLAQVRMSLSLLGFHEPPRANGIRILSLDGGGTRGIMAIEILRQLEQKTNKKVSQLFDYICGVSSGAILALLVGGLRLSMDECESMYRKLSIEIFSQSPIWGTGRLVWNHAYYDTTTWVEILKSVFEEKLLIESLKDEASPKLAAVSAVMNLSTLRAFVFRNYNFPTSCQSQYLGTASHKMWEAVRASGAAPGYFEEFCLDEYLHQDGGIMLNNPAALAIHECRLLWPTESIQCVMSLGSGRYSPAAAVDCTSTSIKTKILKLIDSATDTECVHISLHDLLPSNSYLRFNPYLTEFLYLDETRPEKLQQLKNDAQMYLRRNDYKFSQALKVLAQPRSYHKKIKDYLHVQKQTYF